jgi:hypothetical protein
MTSRNEGTPPPNDLTHYGTKGMHWGVRKGRTGAIANKTKRLDNVVSGKASVREHVVTYSGQSAAGVVKAGGYKKAVAAKSARLKAEQKRLETGHAKVLDLVRTYGTTSVAKVIRSMKD